MEIRAEAPADYPQVFSVNLAVFGRENEANLVEQLRKVASTLSFVAVLEDKIIGYICFSRVSIAGDCPQNLLILGLAPLAVLPEDRKQGIGSALVRYGLKECEEIGCSAVVVLGDPKYYSRFRFITAKTKGLECEYTVPDEAFMVLELAEGALKGCSGLVKYRSEFQLCT
jgi:putative acetyltransferase